MMNVLDKTMIFERWYDSLDDENVKDAIDARIANAEQDNFGDAKSVGDGVYEMRIHYGPGYRLYYFQCGKQLYLLLAGGKKGAQPRDVKLAKAIKLKVERGEEC